VDDQFLYISLREANGAFNDDRTLMIVLRKDFLLTSNGLLMETSKFIDDDNVILHTKTVLHELAADDDIQPGATPCVYMMVLPNHDAVGDWAGLVCSTVRIGAFWKDKDSGVWKYASEDLDLTTPAPNRSFKGVALIGAPGGGDIPNQITDINAFQWSVFWNVMTRRVDGQRRIWAIHHIRAANDPTDAATQLQWYQIRTNNWPMQSGQHPSIDRKERLGLTDPGGVTPVYVHDGSIVANTCGEVAIGFTRAGFRDIDGSSWTYPQFWRALYDSNVNTPPSVAMVAAGASQYYNPGTFNNPQVAWADFSGIACDPLRASRFFAHHMTVYNDNVAGDPGLRSLQWESWVAQLNFGNCGGGSGLMADFNGDNDIDLGDVLNFDALAKEGSPKADLDGNGSINADDLNIILEATGDQP
jgi:hypothetical protein